MGITTFPGFQRVKLQKFEGVEMEFLGEMNIYRESELSWDFEGEIRERRNQQEKNQAGFGGSETNLPLQATLPTLLEQVLHSSLTD